jgi:hypothetical protein
VILHQPTILQTAWPAVADAALLRFMRSATAEYSHLCTAGSPAPPVMVHAMSNAGFVAYGTILHLVSQLQTVRSHASSTVPPSTAANDAPSWAASAVSGNTERKPEAAGGIGGRWGDGTTVASQIEGTTQQDAPAAREEQPQHSVSDPAAQEVLLDFNQLVANTRGISLDSGKLVVRQGLPALTVWERK